MEKEIWKDIEGYEGLYQISNFGAIKTPRIWTGNMHIDREKIIKPTVAKNGYLRVTLTKDKKAKYFNLHRLIAKAFIPNPNNYPIINHIDGNKLNNHIDNLEWCTQKHNIQEAFKIGLAHIKQKEESPKARKVLQYDLEGNFIKKWDYMTQITEVLGYDYTNISKCCRGKLKTSFGYIWKYCEDRKEE